MALSSDVDGEDEGDKAGEEAFYKAEEGCYDECN